MQVKDNCKSLIRSSLRRIWLWSNLRKAAMATARVSRGKYLCQTCKKIVGPKEIDIDHVIPATPPEGIQTPRDWGIFIERLLYCDLNNLVGACKPCHAIKTEKERDARTKAKKEKTKKGSSVRTKRVHTRRTRKNV